MTVLAALSTFFAAVAAWGAVRTIILTREAQTDADERRLNEALIAMKHAARISADFTAVQLASGDADQRFLAAQETLERALADPRLLVTLELLDLTANMLQANQRTDGERVFEMAEQALDILRERDIERYLRMRWYHHLSPRLYIRLNRDAVAASRRRE